MMSTATTMLMATTTTLLVDDYAKFALVKINQHILQKKISSFLIQKNIEDWTSDILSNSFKYGNIIDLRKEKETKPIFSIDPEGCTDRDDAFTFEMILLVCPFVYVGVILLITQKLNRFVQSMLAMVGIECWINLVMILFVTVISPNAPTLITQFIPIIIYIWRLTVISFVFKQMISADNLAAILLTVTFEMLRIMTVLSLMGQVNS